MPRKCNVVVLAAGRGERFAMEGISVPKPLIEFRGVSLLARSVGLALEIADGGRVIVVTVPQVVHAAQALKGVTHVVESSVIQRGPAASGLLAMAHLPLAEPVVFMDCDNYYPAEERSWTDELPIGRAFITAADVPPGLSREQFCNVRAHEDGIVFDVAEKRALGGASKVATGIYGFRSAASFAGGAYCSLLGPSEREPSMSEVLWGESNENSPLTEVIVTAWSPIGTPQQMMEALAHGPQSPTSCE